MLASSEKLVRTTPVPAEDLQIPDERTARIAEPRLALIALATLLCNDGWTAQLVRQTPDPCFSSVRNALVRTRLVFRGVR